MVVSYQGRVDGERGGMVDSCQSYHLSQERICLELDVCEMQIVGESNEQLSSQNGPAGHLNHSCHHTHSMQYSPD